MLFRSGNHLGKYETRRKNGVEARQKYMERKSRVESEENCGKRRVGSNNGGRVEAIEKEAGAGRDEREEQS